MLQESSQYLLDYLSEKGFHVKEAQQLLTPPCPREVTKLSPSLYEINDLASEPIVINNGAALLQAIQISARALRIKLFE
jgi:hypothetical protein